MSGSPAASTLTTQLPPLDGSAVRIGLPVPLGQHAVQTSRDMAAARARTDFDPRKIHDVLRDGRLTLEDRQGVLQVVHADPLLKDWKKRALHVSREQLMALTHLGCRRLVQLSYQHGWDVYQLFEAMGAINVASPLTLHWLAFVPVIMGQGNAEQIDRWGDKAMSHQILGCYLQTELGHGTNVQALETTATFHPETDHFDLHCPTMTSTKWWAGGAGVTATHAVVQAQVHIRGRSYGPHLFFVALRNVHTGQLLPGIHAGDIGPKVLGALGGLDNGWVRFDHVQVPRANLLAKHARVTREGEYIKPPSDKLSYGGMIFIRSQMINDAGWNLSKATTVALRYLSVRRQFRDTTPKAGGSNASESTKSGEGAASDPPLERSVLTYPSVQRRIIPLLAKSYAYILAGRRMHVLYDDMAAQLEQGNTQLLADVHIASSSLKSYCTKQTINGIEECRQALGGHGFSSYSGFATLFTINLPSVTYEGDNYVLAQQVARASIKLFNQLKSDPSGAKGLEVSPTMRFVYGALNTSSLLEKVGGWTQPTTPEQWLSPATYTTALELRAAQHVAHFAVQMDAGRTLSDLSWDAVELARSHAEIVLTMWFAEAVASDAERYGAAQTAYLQRLVGLHALIALQRDLTPLLLSGPTSSPFLTAPSVTALETAVRLEVEQLAAQSIGLTDAFGWTDWELDSSLGRADGKVYESLMAEVEANPLNHPLPPPSNAVGQQTHQATQNTGGSPSSTEADGAPAPLHLGQYKYALPDTGKHVTDSWVAYIGPLLREAALNNGEPIRGDGSKL